MFDNIHKVYSDIIPYVYVDKQCPHGKGHFLSFDTSQCQFPHKFRGGGVGLKKSKVVHLYSAFSM